MIRNSHSETLLRFTHARSRLARRPREGGADAAARLLDLLCGALGELEAADGGGEVEVEGGGGWGYGVTTTTHIDHLVSACPVACTDDDEPYPIVPLAPTGHVSSVQLTLSWTSVR